MPRFNLIKYGDIYLKKSTSLLKCCKDKPAQKNSNGNIARFNEANVPTYLFKRREKIADKTDNYGAKYVHMMVPLKYLSNF